MPSKFLSLSWSRMNSYTWLLSLQFHSSDNLIANLCLFPKLFLLILVKNNSILPIVYAKISKLSTMPVLPPIHEESPFGSTLNTEQKLQLEMLSEREQGRGQRRRGNEENILKHLTTFIDSFLIHQLYFLTWII
jgi:hypothetical protein